MPINLVKKGKATFSKFKICGKINFPEVAKKNNNAAIIIIRIIFL